ncbi:MAG: hypothetical protein GXO43_10200 [Crenarchaeota archaeon]|nr:hypothetical protein [Thermoproteota archaeon]
MKVKNLYATAIVIAMFLIITIPTYADVIENSSITVGAEGYNIFGSLLAGVYSQVTFDYDITDNELTDVDTRNWRYKAWWCFTCYAEITSTSTSVDEDRIYNFADWEMGSWNVDYDGYNKIEVELDNDGYLEVDYWVFIDGEDTFGDTVEGLATNILPLVIQYIWR